MRWLIILIVVKYVVASCPVENDVNERCFGSVFSGPTRVNISEKVYYWSDNGYCGGVGPSAVMQSIRTLCPYSCWICADKKTCIDNYAKCAMYKFLYPDVCDCRDNNTDTKATCEGKSTYGIDLLWMRSNCIRTCFDSGAITGGMICSSSKTKCIYPFFINGKRFDKPISVSTFKPRGYDELQVALMRKPNPTLDMWCSMDRIYNHSSTEIVYNPRTIVLNVPTPTFSTTNTPKPTPRDGDDHPIIKCLQENQYECDIRNLSFIQQQPIYIDKPIRIFSSDNKMIRMTCPSTMIGSMFTIASNGVRMESVEISDCIHGVFSMKNYSVHAFLHVQNSIFYNNGPQVGIVSVSTSNTKTHFVNCTFFNNTARVGSVYDFYNIEDGLEAELVFQDSILHDNYAQVSGGVVYVYPDPKFLKFNLTVLRTLFHHNHADGGSGGVFWLGYLYGSTGTFVNSTFIGNHADFGGVMHIQGLDPDYLITTKLLEYKNSFTFDKCNIHENTADTGAGGILMDQNGIQSIKIDNSNVNGNRAPDGGFMFLVGQKAEACSEYGLIVNNCIVKDNEAYANGGVLYSQGFTSSKWSHTTIQGNVAERGGFLSLPEIGDELRSNVLITNYTVIRSNQATEFGGAIFVSTHTNVSITEDCHMEENKAGIDGGFIRGSNVSMSIQDGIFRGNEAGRNGGSFSITGLKVDMNRVIFSGNGAGQYGGSIFVTGLTRIDINNVLLVGNRARLGGGMYVKGRVQIYGNTTITFRNNTAVDMGGGMVLDTFTGTVPDMQFIDNYMTYRGKGLGGAIGMISTNVDYSGTLRFVNNSALNGADIGCMEECNMIGGTLPFSIRSSTMTLSVAPGHAIPLVELNVVDAFGQPAMIPEDMTLALLVDRRMVVISSLVNRIRIENVTMYGKPSEQTKLVITPDPVTHISGYYRDHVENMTLVLLVQFLEDCPEGEIFRVDRCVDTSKLVPAGYWIPEPKENNYRYELCPVGTQRPSNVHALRCVPCLPGYISTPERVQCNYCATIVSLSWNTSNLQCDACPEGAQCFGGERVVPKNGYYHSSPRSYQFHECISNKACTYEGRIEKLENLRSGIENHYINAQCADGYTGVLCGSCADGFIRSGIADCRKCASLTANILYFVFTFFILVVFLVYTVLNTLYKDISDQTLGLSIKTIVSFIQQIAALGSFRVGWPELVMDMTSFATGVTSSEMKSVACMFHGTTDVPVFVMEALMIIYVVPLVLIVLVPSILWIYTRKRPDKMLSIVIVVYFFLYPLIVTHTIKLLSCVSVDREDVTNVYTEYAMLIGSKYLLIDTHFECYTLGGWHASSIYGIAIPSLILFVSGLPISLMVYIWKWDVKRDKFSFIYSGLRKDRWWWFFIVSIRTSILSCIGIIVRNAGYQNLVAQGWLLSYILLSSKLRPYLTGMIHSMEILSVLCILALLYINIWMLMERINGMVQDSLLFGILCIVCTALTLISLLWMASTVLIAKDENIYPSQVSKQHVRSFLIRRYNSIVQQKDVMTDPK